VPGTGKDTAQPRGAADSARPSELGPRYAATAAVTGIVLAGGRGRRMGGVDKGLQAFRGRPMVEWVLERLVPQVGEVLINANQNLERYAEYGYRVVPDEVGGFAGPLAGLHRGMKEALSPLVATVPCDSPFFPLDLIQRLARPVTGGQAQLSVARTGPQAHPVFCVARRDLLAHLEGFLAQGGRKIDAWYASLRVVEVAFDDEPEAFGNFNTLEELRAGELLKSETRKRDDTKKS
jgi:molybdopterin-guanine dinucleotide biosynthesis protein A